MPIYRVTAEWSGFPGAPGYSSFHFNESPSGDTATGARAAVHQFFSTLAPALPQRISVDVDPVIEVYDEASGSLTGWEDDPEDLDPIDGARTGDFVGPTGAVVNWITATVSNGRRLRGRTFLVPLAEWAYSADGTLSEEAMSTVNDAASVLSSPEFDHDFVIWSRPTGGGTGAVGSVIQHRVPDMAAVLRSRRD